jgi:hypothetical protein
VTITFDEMVSHWGQDDLVQMPVERYARVLRVDPRTLSPEAALPADVPVLFTAEVSGNVKLFSLVTMRFGNGAGTVRLIVLGAVPADPRTFYCLDANGGGVALVRLEGAELELINSNMATFVEFLLRVDQLVAADQGTRVAHLNRVRDLRGQLAELDPVAFENPQSWWTAAFEQLLARA